MESNTTRAIADVLAGVPASVWERAARSADEDAARRRQARRDRRPEPCPNPWGIRGVPTRDSLRRIVEPWCERFLCGGPKASIAIHRTRACLLDVRRSRGRAIDAQPLDPLRVLDREIRAYGVETITLRTGHVVSYVNLGETYAQTLLLIVAGGRTRYAIGAWGDLVEKHGGA